MGCAERTEWNERDLYLSWFNLSCNQRNKKLAIN